MFRDAGDLGFNLLNSLFYRAMDEEWAPAKCVNSFTVPLFKDDGKSLIFDKYR